MTKSRPLMAILSTVILGTRESSGAFHLHLHGRTDAQWHPKPYQNDLHSVSASSAADIWAVGQTRHTF